MKHAILLYITLAVTAGMIGAFFWGTTVLWILCPFLPATLILKWVGKKSLRKGVNLAFLASAAFSFAFFGSVLFLLRETKPTNHLSRFTGADWEIEGIALRDSRAKEKGNQLIIEVTGICVPGSKTEKAQVSGSMLVYYPAGQNPVQQHSTVRFTAKAKEIKGAFGEKGGWAYRNNIGAMGFTKSLEVTGKHSSVWTTMAALRMKFETAFTQRMPDPSISSLAIAMLLGNTADLDPEITRAYSTTGVSHIISISGLHVAIIFQFILILFSALLPSRIPARAKVITALLILWVYAMLTGACPAVCRASFMITLVAIARAWSLRVKMANLLGFAALVLLVWEPFLLFDIGFQLSFVAVAGLIIAGKFFKQISEAKLPGLPSFIHEINGASLAAQLFTLPLILFHFGQFPTYFLAANLLVIPIADLAIKVGFGAMLLCFIPGVNELLFRILDLLLWGITAICEFIAGLPGAVAASPSLSDDGIKVLLLLAGVVLVASLLMKKLRSERLGMN